MATITTPRLTLSPFEPADWPFFHRLREAPEIMRYMAAIAPEKEIRRLFAARLTAPHTFVIRVHDDATPLGLLACKSAPTTLKRPILVTP